jgi:hypothetical protein
MIFKLKQMCFVNQLFITIANTQDSQLMKRKIHFDGFRESSPSGGAVTFRPLVVGDR